MPRLKVAVLFGGRSGEHEVSLVSGASVAGALSERHDVIPVLIDRQGRRLLQSTLPPERAEPLVLQHAPPQPDPRRRTPEPLGSSVGVSKVKQAAELGPALDIAFAYDRKVVVEAAVKDNRELEISILGNDEPAASVPGEIIPDREFYDYDSKYSAESRTQLLIPAPLDAAVAAEVGRLGIAAFRAVDACGYARVDFLLERATGKILVNEINTIPGFTSISMFPKLWAASGVPYAELLARLASLALERHAERARLRTD